MRIACGYLPSFALQAHARRAAHLAGRPFAVGSLDPHPTVVSCSRAAWDRGIRVGMAIAQARARASELIVEHADPGGLGVDAAAAVAECLLALSDRVELGPLPSARAGGPPHLAVYLRVPTGTRGDSFGNKVLTQLARQGFRGRVGIADDRFAAFAAAATLRGRRVTDAHDEPPPQPSPASREREQHYEAAPFSQTVTCVPRGGSSAFLAPLALGLLPMDPDLLEMLGRIGIKTLGEFAALPPPSLGQGWTVSGVDLQALARGDGDAEMSGFTPPAMVTDGIRLAEPLAGAEPVLFLLRPLFDRVADRMRGRGTAADRVVVRLVGATDVTTIELTPAHPTVSSRELVELVRARLGGRDVGGPIVGIDVVVNRESDPDGEELELFGSASAPAQATPARFVSTARESHRRTMRGQRGKKGRKRGPGSGGDHATGTLFD